MVDERGTTETLSKSPLIRLPREIRDKILYAILAPDYTTMNDWFLGFSTYYAKDGASRGIFGNVAFRSILGNRDSPINHPIRRVSKQLNAESTDALRHLFSSRPFRIGPSDSWMMYLILQAVSPGLCSIVSAVTIDDEAFDNIAGETNSELWSGVSKHGHIGELILSKFPNMRSVQIKAPVRNCIYLITHHHADDNCTMKRYDTCILCAHFFAEALRRGRLDRLEIVIIRDKSKMTTERDIMSTDPAFPYWAACNEPWNGFHVSKTFIDNPTKYWVPSRSRDEIVYPEWEKSSRTWTVTYKRKERP